MFMRYIYWILLPALVLPLLFVTDATAQRQYSFEELRQREFYSPAFMLVFPGVTDESGNPNVSSVFKIRYDQLDFRSVPASQRQNDDERFATEVRLDFEVYRQGADGDRTGSPVNRQSWRKRVSTTNFDDTASRSKFIEASQAFDIEPGSYVMRANVFSSDRRRGTFTRRFEVPDDQSDYNWVMLTQQDESTERPRLINLGNNAHFGQELTTWAVLPDADLDYRVQVDRMRIQDSDTTEVETVFNESISSDDIYANRKISIITENNAPFLSYENEGDQHIARIELPNKTFQNRHYRMRIFKDNEENDTSPITDYTWYNLWVDMPYSLLNVDFAIRKLRYMVDNSKISELQRGNRRAREEQLLDFWKERDPEPETSYNQVMTEYYRRVDEAYDRFTTPTQNGFESDRGKIFITRGEPDNINRRYPSNRPTQEIWEYSDTTYIFEATTGFGDYRLVEER